jgi:hypothetical protein
MAELLADLHDALAWLRRREGGWTDRLGRLLNDPHWAGLWRDHVTDTAALLAQMAELTRTLAGHLITVPAPAGAEPKRLLAQLAEMRQRFAAGKGRRRAAAHRRGRRPGRRLGAPRAGPAPPRRPLVGVDRQAGNPGAGR